MHVATQSHVFFYCTFMLDCSVQVNCSDNRFMIKFRCNELLRWRKTCSYDWEYAAKIYTQAMMIHLKFRVGNADWSLNDSELFILLEW